MKKGGLGKGLDALFVDNTSAEAAVRTLRISEIEPNENQPRRNFDVDALQQLADSIAEHGLLQPIVVRPLPNGMYQIVAGERRWRAAKLAGLTKLPANILELDDRATMELALIENLQRSDLNPVEEALGYQQLMQDYQLTQEQVAERVGKSRPVVANALRLLQLPEPVITLLQQGKLTAGHARALLALEDRLLIEQTAQLAAQGRLTVRAIEERAKARKKAPRTPTVQPTPTYYTEVALALTEQLGCKVKVSTNGQGGMLQIPFYSDEELKLLAERLSREE